MKPAKMMFMRNGQLLMPYSRSSTNSLSTLPKSGSQVGQRPSAGAGQEVTMGSGSFQDRRKSCEEGEKT